MSQESPFLADSIPVLPFPAYYSEIARALVVMLLSQDREWWESTSWSQVPCALYEIWRSAGEHRATAAALLRALLEDAEVRALFDTSDVDAIEFVAPGEPPQIPYVSGLIERIAAWLQPGERGRPVRMAAPSAAGASVTDST